MLTRSDRASFLPSPPSDRKALGFNAQSRKSSVLPSTAYKDLSASYVTDINESFVRYEFDVDEALREYCSASEKFLRSNETEDFTEFSQSDARLKQLNVTEDLIDRFTKTYSLLQEHQRALSNANRPNTRDDNIFINNNKKALCIKDLLDPTKEQLFISLYDIKTDCNSPKNPRKPLTPLEYYGLIRDGYEDRTSSSSQPQDLSLVSTPPQSPLSEQNQGTDEETWGCPDTPPAGPGQPLPLNAPEKKRPEMVFTASQKARRRLDYSSQTESPSNPAPLSPFSLNQEAASPVDSTRSFSSGCSSKGSAASRTLSSNGSSRLPRYNTSETEGSSTTETPEDMRDHSYPFSSKSVSAIDLTTSDLTTVSIPHFLSGNSLVVMDGSEGREAGTGSSFQSEDLPHASIPPQSPLLKHSQETGNETSCYHDTPPPGPGQHLPFQNQGSPAPANAHKKEEDVKRKLFCSSQVESPSNPAPLSPFSQNQESTSPADSSGSISSGHSSTGSTPSITPGLMESLGLLDDPLQNHASPTPETPEAIRGHSSGTSSLQFRHPSSSDSLLATHGSMSFVDANVSRIPNLSFDSGKSVEGDLLGLDSPDLSNEPSEYTNKIPLTAGTNYFLETPRQFETSTKAPSPPLSTFSSNQESTSPADSTASSLSDPLNTGSTPSNTLGSTESPGLLNNPLQNLGSPTSKTPETPERIRCSSDISHMQSPSSSSSKFSYTIHGSPTSYQTTMSNSSSISSDYNPLQAFSVHLSNEPSEHTQKKSPTAGIDGFLKLLFKPLEPITKAVGASQSRASNHQPVRRKLPNYSSVLDRTPRPPIPNPGTSKKEPKEYGILTFLCGALAPNAVAPRADNRGKVN